VARNVQIGRRSLGENQPILVVAETAAGHMGEFELARKLIEIASRAKCDAIKFHVELAEETLVPTHPDYPLAKKLEFNEQEWRDLFTYAKQNELLIISMTNDVPSVDLVARCGTDAYYAHPGNIVDPTLVRKIASKMKPVFLGTGASTLDEINEAVAIAGGIEGNKNLILMYGYQAYPTRIEDNNIRFLETLRRVFDLNVGFADHTDGESRFSGIIPLLAIAAGATVVEKHFTVDRKLKLLDYQSAMNAAELSEFVTQVRTAESSLGSFVPHAFSKDEKAYGRLVRKNIVSRRPIAKGETIDQSMIAFKRSPPGISPRDAWQLIGRISRRDIDKDEVLLWYLLE